MLDKINLNADVGESFGAWVMGNDHELFGSIGAANIACGFHGGDPLILRRTLRLAKASGTSVGAHPSYPDLQGFGRRRLQMAPDELQAAILYQISAVDGLARVEGLCLSHVKPHGALNNAACEDRALADVIAQAVCEYDRQLILLAPALSLLALAGRDAGLAVIEEVYADRAYLDDGRLVPRGRPEALIHSAEASCAQVDRMLQAEAIVTVGGKRLPCRFGSVCVHGDSPAAVATAGLLQRRLVAAGYATVTLPEML